MHGKRENEKDSPAEDNRNSFCFHEFNLSAFVGSGREKEEMIEEVRGLDRQFESLNCLLSLHRNYFGACRRDCHGLAPPHIIESMPVKVRVQHVECLANL